MFNSSPSQNDRRSKNLPWTLFLREVVFVHKPYDRVLIVTRHDYRVPKKLENTTTEEVTFNRKREVYKRDERTVSVRILLKIFSYYC